MLKQVQHDFVQYGFAQHDKTLTREIDNRKRYIETKQKAN
jgi:hypothetical protein